MNTSQRVPEIGTRRQSQDAPVIVPLETIVLPQAAVALVPPDQQRGAFITAAQSGSSVILLPPGSPDQRSRKVGVRAEVLAIANPHQLDGEFVLRGTGRVAVHQSVLGSSNAVVTPLPDIFSPTPTIDRVEIRRQLILATRELLPNHAQALQHHWWETQLSLGGLCDVLAHVLALESRDQLQVLKELDVDRRCRLVLACLHAHPLTLWKYPPPFSSN